MHWFTNIDHGRRHQPLQLMTMADNVRFSKHKEIRGIGYKSTTTSMPSRSPFTDAIPSDYDGMMGVPITFLDKHDPDQFEIFGTGADEVPDKKYGRIERLRQRRRTLDREARQ